MEEGRFFPSKGRTAYRLWAIPLVWIEVERIWLPISCRTILVENKVLCGEKCGTEASVKVIRVRDADEMVFVDPS